MSETRAKSAESISSIEENTIQQVPLDQRHGRNRDMFTIWFGTNIMILAIVTGALATTVFGQPAWSAVLAIVLGNLFGAVFMALHSAQGPTLGVPQMVQTKGQFGSLGSVLIVLVVVCMYTGFFISILVFGGASLASVMPFLGGYRTSEYFYFLTLLLVGVCFWLLRRIVGSPFGRILTTIRENPERAEFIGVNVRRYELAAFVLAGAFAGLAGGLFGIFNRGVFPDFAYWTKSSEVLIMTLLGGMGAFFGPAVGALVLLWLNQQIVSYTQYWPLILGIILIALLFVFPGGLAGAAALIGRRLMRKRRAHA